MKPIDKYVFPLSRAGERNTDIGTIQLREGERKKWDEESSISYAPSTTERAPLDDYEPLLLDFDDFPTMPPAQRQQPTAARSREHYQGAPANNISQGRPLLPSSRQSLYQQQASTQSNGRHQGALVSGAGRRGPQITDEALHQIPSIGYQKNGNHHHYDIGYHESSCESSSASTEILTPSGSRQPRDGNSAGRGYMNRHGGPSSTSRHQSTKAAWAEPAGLVTTRRAKDLEAKALKDAERKKYLRKPLDEDSILAYGFYIWPQEDGSVIEVLGPELELLKPIRIDHKVFIEWAQENGTQDVLKISSESSHSERHIAAAIKGIRLAIEDAKARAILAAPKYFVVPPTASAMRSFIGPKKVITKTEMVDGVEKTKNTTCIGTQLVGEKLSGKEKDRWRKRRATDQDTCAKEFQGRLFSSLMELAALKDWMRMRVYFGHLVFKKFPSEYAASQKSFDQFVQMMGLSQIRGEIERMIPATVAMKLRKKIVDWPERFRPAQGRTFSLEDVNFKDTEIILVTTQHGDDLRVEADIDVTYDDDNSVRYQVGCCHVFHDDQRNKRVELSIIDPERQVDYTLQVITDSEVVIPETCEEFRKLTEGSIPAKTRVRYDALGLPYPEVHPQCPPGLQITKFVVQSAIQYALMDSGYVIEIAIYRTCYHKTRSEPETTASVSMFHPQWDLDMESIENTTKERTWDRGLNNFFYNGIGQESNGFENFLAEVETIQGFLCDAANEAEKEAAEEAAQERTRDIAPETAEEAKKKL